MTPTATRMRRPPHTNDLGACYAPEFNVSELSAISADVGTLTAGIIQNSAGNRYIDLDASGTDSFIQHDNFEIWADGTAVFSGNLVAASGTFAGEVSGDFFSANEMKVKNKLSVNWVNQGLKASTYTELTESKLSFITGISPSDTAVLELNDGLTIGSDRPITLRTGGTVAGNGVFIDDLNTPSSKRVACVHVASGSPSGEDYPDGTLWCDTS